MRNLRILHQKHFKTILEKQKVEINESFNCFCAKSVKFSKRFRDLEKQNNSTTIAIDIQLGFVGSICSFVFGKCLKMTRRNLKCKF